MRKKTILQMSLLALSAVAVGCTDNNYDLSDIDTTVQVGVRDLVVPVNIDEISLKSIIDFNDDNIQEINGEYTYVKDGSFASSKVEINAVNLNPGKIKRVSLGFSLPSIPGIASDGRDIQINVKPGDEGLTTYDFTSVNISPDIYDITNVKGNFSFNIDISFSGVSDLINGLELNDFVLQLPVGLEIENTPGLKYDASTGLLSVSRSSTTTSVSIPVKATGLNIAAGAFANHSLSIKGTAGVIGGTILFKTRNGASIPSGFTLDLDITFPNGIVINEFSGEIGYAIDNLNINDIDISNLPDVLSQPGTNLILTNPCLYLSVTNPLYESGLQAQAGLSITAFHGEDGKTYAINNGTFVIPANRDNAFCFSPAVPANPDSGFPNFTHVPYTSLSDVLSGDGVPDRLRANIINPAIPRQRVTAFRLGYDYGQVVGEYKFVAPLQFKQGTRISYSDIVDGWYDDLKDLTITTLEVNFNITTDIPVGVNLTGYPLDKNGNRIAGASIQGATIAANASNQAVTITVTGPLDGVDGIEFTADAMAADGNALSPSMKIVLKNLRPKVTGHYRTEL